jgi:hypothetical protein
MSLRAADYRTEVNHVTIGEMTRGRIPQMESVVKFARGFGLDVNEWLAAAGYAPLAGAAAAKTPTEALGEGLWQLKQKYELPRLVIGNWGGITELTHADVARILGEVEEDILAELEEERGEG